MPPLNFSAKRNDQRFQPRRLSILVSLGRSNRAQSAGQVVSELRAEIPTATAMVRPN